MWAGDWRRPHHYTTPEDEVEAVRTRVGVIDVSTLGKFRVQGPEAVDAARTPLPEPVRRPPDRADPLRRDAERRGRDRRRRNRRPGRRRRVLRHRHHREHRGARAVDHVVERRLGSRRPGPERHGRLRGGEPRRSGVARRDAVAHRRRRLRRCRPVPVGDDDGGGRRPGARAPDRVRRRARVRDPRAVDVRGARVGRGHGGRRAARDPSRSVSRRSGSSGWRSSTSWSGRTRTPSPTRSRSGSAGRSRPTRTTSSASAGSRGSTRRHPASGSSGSRARGSGCRPRARAWSTTASGWVGSPRPAASAAAGGIVGLAWVPAGWASDGTPFEIQFGPHRANATVAMRPFYDPDGARLRS